MNYAGFCGPSSQSQSLIADAERTVNLYYEKTDSPYAPTGSALYPTPGRRALFTVADIGDRGSFVAAGRAFVVRGGGFYEVFAVALPTKISALAQDNNKASFAFNAASGGQLCIASGTNLYHYNLTTGVFTQVLTGETTTVGYAGGRFLSFNRATGQVRLSALNDGTTYTAQFFARSEASDRWREMIMGSSEIFMIGEETSEFWYNSGATPQPFAFARGSNFESGTCAPASAARVGGSFVWVSGSKDGKGRIMRADGYSPRPFGNYAVETALSRYARESTIDDAEVMPYEQEGHLFAVFSFPTAQASWAVDMETGSWHELGDFDSATNRYRVWGPRTHCVAFNKHLVGDRTSGVIAELDVNIGDDLGRPIRRLRMGPPLWASSREQILVSRFSVIVENGLGAVSGQGNDPKLMARFSKDAKRWSAERQAGVGRLGEYAHRCYFTRLGASEPLWVPEVSFTDPIPLRLLAAELEGSGFTQRRAAA